MTVLAFIILNKWEVSTETTSLEEAQEPDDNSGALVSQANPLEMFLDADESTSTMPDAFAGEKDMWDRIVEFILSTRGALRPGN